MTSVDVVIVSYRDAADLKKCTEALAKNCPECNVIVVDNNETNVGYTAGCNLGIERGSGDLIWLLNSDAVPLENCIAPVVKLFADQPRCGIVGCVQLDPDNPDRVSHAGGLQCWPGGIHAGGFLSQGFRPRRERQIWVNGAAIFLRRTMVAEIGPLDENLFLYYSDSDYCLWARALGWEVWLEPESRVLHTLRSSRSPDPALVQADAQAFADKWAISGPAEGRWIVGQTFRNLATAAQP